MSSFEVLDRGSSKTPVEEGFAQDRWHDFPISPPHYSNALSSPSQLLPNLPALLLLAWLVFFFRIWKDIVSICCKFGRADV